MTPHTFRKSSHEGIGFLIIELNDVRYVFATAFPRRGLTLRQQAGDTLRTIEAEAQKQGTGGSIVHQPVFVQNVSMVFT